MPKRPLGGQHSVRGVLALAWNRQKLAASLCRDDLALVTETALPPGRWARHAVLPRQLEGYRNQTSGALYSLERAHWATGG